MIPLRDTNPRQGPPIVNIALIALNVIAFVWELSLGVDLQRQLAAIAFIPRELWTPGGVVGDSASIFTSMFLHGGWLHLGSNMLYLWIFGDNVEDRMGHGGYLAFYVICGIVAALAHAVFNPGSTLPAIGASGAVAGVLGAYIVLFPHAHVMTLIPFGFFITMRELPALLMIGLWFVMQLFSGAMSITATAQDTGGVAWFAHIGGFVAGLGLVFLFRKKQAETRYPHFR
ncbi:MAG: rhomboid family intramembrane serine protease [Thermoanaerobaculia bacterium]